jgi:hypothetical protein
MFAEVERGLREGSSVGELGAEGELGEGLDLGAEPPTGLTRLCHFATAEAE